ncbi:MAG: hypothetical protein JW818_01260 [Pirellulales bacterium]|nr:hypothetical protein [Pirellulales bacterium]
MAIHPNIRKLDADQAEARREQLRRQQAARDKDRRHQRLRTEFRRNLIAAVQGTFFVAGLIGFVVLICWLALSGTFSPWQVRVH